MKFHTLSIVLTAIFVAVIGYPLVIHLWLGWQRKADDVLLSMSPSCKRTYLKTFQNQAVDLDKAETVFNTFYYSWYGRKFLLAPIFLVVCVATLLSYILADTGLFELYDFNKTSFEKAEYVHLPRTAAAALVGAYGFVAWDLVWRTSKRNLLPGDIMGGAIRMLIAIPLGYSFAALLNEGLGPFIAFAASAFPLQTVQTMLQHLANKQLGAEMGASASKDQVGELSCVDRVIADRLEDADITTVCQLAYCDPVQISMRTNLGFSFVSDIAGQALAYIYLGNKLADLRPLGLRGAFEISNLCDEVAENEPTAIAVREKAASIMGMSPEVFQNVAEEIGEDPYTIFLTEMWGD
jgi:hypothetical protein